MPIAQSIDPSRVLGVWGPCLLVGGICFAKGPAVFRASTLQTIYHAFLLSVSAMYPKLSKKFLSYP